MLSNILTFILVLPLIGIVINSFLNNAKVIKLVSLFTTLITFVASLILIFKFDYSNSGYQFEETYLWIRSFNMSYHLGIDGISLSLIMLTTFLMPFCILASWNSIEHRIKLYYSLFLLLETLIIGVFTSLDFVLFYIFFEALLIPMFFIIGIWGGENRIYATFKFFLYTLIGSVFLLIAIIYIYNRTSTMDITIITYLVPTFDLTVQKYLWLAFFASFAVKIPMWPFHTWLPDAHVQAPTAGSVILAGVLLKMGGYGFIRFSLPMLPDASLYFSKFVFILSLIAVIYASLVAFAQEDMKKLIAYSSVAHMGYVTIGIFSMKQNGIDGAMMQMISHGLVSGALFLAVGMLYDRMHTKEIAKYGGLATIMPKFAFCFMVFTFASVGLPGTSGFIGEFLTMLAMYNVNKLFGIICTVGMVIGAAYMLVLAKKVIFGEVLNNSVRTMNDLRLREMIIFIPLVILVVVMGIYPNLISEVFMNSTINLVKDMNLMLQ